MIGKPSTRKPSMLCLNAMPIHYPVVRCDKRLGHRDGAGNPDAHYCAETDQEWGP